MVHITVGILQLEVTVKKNSYEVIKTGSQPDIVFGITLDIYIG